MGNNMLLVIGNGFDLNCGLKSSYGDFFEYSNLTQKDYKELCITNTFSPFYCGSIKHAVIEAAKDSNQDFSIWDLIFIMNSEDLSRNKWCDVEQVIKKTLESNIWSEVITNINYFQKNGEWQNDNWPNWLYSLYIIDRYYDNNNWLAQKMGFNPRMLKIKQISKSELLSNLLSELNIFENRFKKYLLSQERENLEYAAVQQKTIDHISETSKASIVSIISFNYTDLKYKSSVILNIHGKLLNDNIIFGVDFLNTHSQFDAFTKSNRRVNAGIPILNEVLNTNIDVIAFYGLSLSLHDINYYDLIFKKYGTSGKAKYIFFYSNYGGHDRKKDNLDNLKNFFKYLKLDFYHLYENGIIVLELLEVIQV